METNFIEIKKLYKKKDYHGLKLDGLVHDDRSHAVILNNGMPIILKVNNNEDIAIFNNQRYKIIRIGTFTIPVKEFKKELKINIPVNFQALKICHHYAQFAWYFHW